MLYSLPALIGKREREEERKKNKYLFFFLIKIFSLLKKKTFLL